MKFSCDQCSAQYMIADEKVGTRGVKVKCKKCGHVIVVKPAAASEPAVERRDTEVAPAAAGGGFGASPFNEPTMAMSASQLASLKAATADAPAAPAASPASDNAPTAGFSASAFGASPFANPFSSQTTDPAGMAPAGPTTLPPVAATDPAMPVPPDNGGLSAFSMPAPEGRPSGEFNLDHALGTAPAVAPQPSGRPAGEKEWYVAIDEAQIGPVDLREIEQRWDAKELTEDSLAWKGGMGDWMPIAEIQELAYLVTERPQQKPQAAASYVSMPSTSAAPGPTLPQAMGPMAFAGSDVEISGVSWKPSAASALSSLVQEELVSSGRSEEPVAKASSPTDMGMPQFGATDLFGKGGNGGTGVPAVPAGPSFAAGPADPFAASQNWSVPKPVQSSGIKPMTLMLAVMGLVVAGLIAVVVVILFRPQPAQVAAVGPTNPATTAVAPTPVPTPAPSTVTASPTPTPTPVEPPDAGTKALPGKGKLKGKAKASDTEDNPKPTKGKGKDPLKDLFEDDKKPAAAASLKDLGKDDVVAGVRSNAKLLGPCLQAAKAKNELAPGKHVLVLDFVIKPNGSVTEGQLKGPAYVMSTSMPGCFAQKMKSWTFPPSKNGIPSVKNFPLPFTMQ